MKKLISLFLAVTICLTLGGTALAQGSAELPRPDVYLGSDCLEYETEIRTASSGAYQFQFIEAGVALEDIDELVGYVELLAAGPFDLEIFYDENLDAPEQIAGAIFEYTGDARTGTIDKEDGIYTAGSAPVQVLIYPVEEAGMAWMSMVCAEGFELVKDWDGGEEPSSDGGGFSLKDFLGLGGPAADPLPDPRSALASNKKSLDIEQMDDETIDGVTYSVYSYSFTYSYLSADSAHGFYEGMLKAAGYTLSEGEDGDDRIAYTISDNDGNTAVLIEYKKPTMSFSSWWTLYVPEGMAFDYGGDASLSGVAGGSITGGSFQNGSYIN